MIAFEELDFIGDVLFVYEHFHKAFIMYDSVHPECYITNVLLLLRGSLSSIHTTFSTTQQNVREGGNVKSYRS